MITNIFKKENIILNYHRICPDNVMNKPNDELAVSVSRFREQLLFLKKNYNLISLDNLLKFEKSSKTNICITFDDGYKDNLIYALPILNEFNIPATIYIITKFYEKDFNVWWYELENFIWKNTESISFVYEGKKYEYSVQKNIEKFNCFVKLRKVIKKLDKENQLKFLSAVTKTKEREQFKKYFLSKEDIKILNSNPLITIGAHTHNHLSLKNLSRTTCIEEIKLSKEILENSIGININHFSYPYGSKSDVGKREHKIVQDLGFKSAVTTSVGKVNKNSLFNLPRIHINEKTNEKNLKIKMSFSYYLYRNIKEIFNRN